MATDIIPWKFLSDEAVDQADSDCFGVHSAYARLLLRISQTSVTPFSIGLYGNWGTGKTSVARILQSLAAREKNLSVIYLDVWKYSSDPLKRWILLETERQLKSHKILDDYRYQGRTLQSHLEFEEQLEDQTTIKLDGKILLKLLGILALTAVVIVLFSLYAPTSWKANGVVAGLIVVLGGVGFFSLVATAVFGELLKGLSAAIFRRTVRHTSAKPAFSSEKFGEIFGDLVRRGTDGGGRLLFVFDNLDRCSEQVAVETIGVIKTYLDERNCIYLIPCDEDALVKHISRSYLSPEGTDQEGYAREFLNKFFQVTLRLPASSEFEIEKFLDKQLELAAMSDLPVGARDVLVLGYMGHTPRQVKRMINDLIAFRSLAVEAESCGLLAKGLLTADLSLLTKVCVISTKWPAFLARLAEDPEMWSEAERAEFGSTTTNASIGLKEFLGVTRHVAPNSDVRPFLFMKHFDFERDTGFSKAIEDCLRKGDWVAYRGLVLEERLASRKALALDKTMITVRQWLAADRQIILSNSAPLIVKVALLLPERRELNVLAVQVLERIAERENAAEFEKVVDIRDVFEIDPQVLTPQKSKILDKVIELFRPDLEANSDREKSWMLVLEQQQQLTTVQKGRIAVWIKARIEGKDGEEPVLRLLKVAESRPLDFAWLLQESLLQRLVDQIDFSGIAPDPSRLKVLVGAQSLLSTRNSSTLARKLAKLVSGATNQMLAQHGVAALLQLNARQFAQEDADSLCDQLLKQYRQDGISAGSMWLQALLHLRPALGTEKKEEFESSVSADFEGMSDPDAFADGLRSLTAEERAQLLGVAGVRSAMHSQAEALEGLGRSTDAISNRKQIVECFDPLQIASLELFDETREWDLVILVDEIKRAAATGAAQHEARKKLLEFCNKFVLAKLPDATDLYNYVSESVQAQPDLLSTDLASSMGPATLDLFDQDLPAYYPWFQFWRRSLAPQQKADLIRQISDRFLRSKVKDDRIPMLKLVSADVVADIDLRRDQRLVKEIFDYAFEAADDQPTEGAKVVLELMPFLADQHLRDYIDRALDTLITYETTKASLVRMEPFLSMIESPAARLSDADLDKVAKFCRRMLGSANTADEQTRALGLVVNLKRPELVDRIRGELEQLTNSDVSGIAGLAKSLFQQGQNP